MALASESLNAITCLSTESDTVEEVALTKESQASVSIDEEIVIGYAFVDDDTDDLDDILPMELAQLKFISSPGNLLTSKFHQAKTS